MSGPHSAHLLAALLAAAGTTHLVAPGPFDQIVPRQLPGSARAYTYTSGVAELAVAALLAAPRTRQLGGTAAAALFVAVFPANLQMAWDWRHRSAPARAIAYGRLPLQAVLIRQALRVATGPAGGPSLTRHAGGGARGE
ncbi:MauE/DoxX family redox-associated membrane protein [Georgenia sp. Z1344]|uniref:MauE/DoxX family redox-associated membrane protein n=1 Tax=Georgenia sp. Z1344 TaxID=3416706 RepID=UPI003CF76B2F